MIKIINFSASTIKGETLLKDVNFEIQNSDFIFLQGRSGSGKSLLSRFIAGIPHDSRLKITGNVMFDETILSSGYLKDDKIRIKNYVNIIFQNPSRVLNKMLSVMEHIKEASYSIENSKEKISWICDYFGFTKIFLDKYPFMLSEGEKQRLVIAMCMIQKPSLLIADEIISSQDDENGILILELIKQIHQDQNIPVILISHNRLDFKSFINKHFIIKDNMLVEL